MITKNTDDKQPPARTFFCFKDILIPLVKCQHMEMLEEGLINDSEQKFVFKGLYKYYQFFFGKSTILGALWYGSCSLSGIFRRAGLLYNAEVKKLKVTSFMRLSSNRSQLATNQNERKI